MPQMTCHFLLRSVARWNFGPEFGNKNLFLKPWHHLSFQHTKPSWPGQGDYISVFCSFSRFITQEYHKMEVQPKIPVTLTTAVSWRPEGIEYKKNEVFLDVIESVNMLVSPSKLDCFCWRTKRASRIFGEEGQKFHNGGAQHVCFSAHCVC